MREEENSERDIEGRGEEERKKNIYTVQKQTEKEGKHFTHVHTHVLYYVNLLIQHLKTNHYSNIPKVHATILCVHVQAHTHTQ